MPDVADRQPAVSPVSTAALLLAARTLLGGLRLPRPSVLRILEATGATRSRAYELRDELLERLPDLERPVGRPRLEKPAPVDTGAITREVLDFVVEHPGCICRCAERMRYSDSFRRFVLELCERERQISIEEFACGSRVPLGTLKDWLRGGASSVDHPAEADSTFAPQEAATGSRLETLLAAWRSWSGSFTAFCQHVSHDLRIPYGRTLIASILEAHGERSPQRRSGRSPDEKAIRGSFETFFPGAQWEGDGTPIAVEINEQRFDFNLELMVDAHSDASVGISIRNEEDSRAVLEAFEDGVETTGAPPLAVLLDNRPSNHTDSVDEALGSTLRMRATKGRGQNKAHVEGAFGLFSQIVPLIAIAAASPKDLARQILELVTQTWARTLNHRPRADRGGSSRVEIYQTEAPTPEQVEQAQAALAERCKRQELAQQTLKARQDPVARAILDEAFTRLGLEDPQGNIRSAIARYPLEAIVSGIATFEGKRAARTLPLGVDGGRYLLGIVRNIAQQDEGLQIAEALLRARLDARDRLLTPLHKSLGSLLELIADPVERLKALADLALATDRRIDRLFWLDALAAQLRSQPEPRHSALLRFAARRIHAAHALDQSDRQAAVRHLFAQVIPLEN